MNCIKWLAICSLFILSACGSVPQKGSSVDNARIKQTIPAGAEQAYEQALVVIDQKDWVIAETLLLAMQTQYPKLASVTSTLGWVYWQQGDGEKAIAVLEPLIGNSTLYKPDAYMHLALIYTEQGLFKKAESLYDLALTIWPNDVDLLINAGILQDLYIGQLSKALGYYQQAQAKSTSRNKALEGWVKDLERRVQ